MNTRFPSLIAHWILLATTGFAMQQARADDSRAAQVDAMFAEFDRADTPGCAVGIIQDGELIYSRGFGSANLEHEVANTPGTVFEIGSVAKSFTCACIAILLDRGAISADDDIRRYLPEMHEFDPPVRIRHLIRCRSGIWAQWHIAQLAGWSAEPIEAPYRRDDMLTLLSGQKTLPFEPGTQFRYGTGDYFLLGMIVERATGQSLAEFARANLFAPLGMSKTFIMEDPARVVKQRATGYYRHHKGHWLGWNQNARAPGGRGLHTNIEDLYRWDRNFEKNRLPSGEHLEEFLRHGTLLENRNVLDATPTGEYRGVKRVQFTGGMPGYAAAMTRFPEQRFTVICLANNSSINPRRINAAIADLYLADVLRPLDASQQSGTSARLDDTPIDLETSELRDKVGAYRLRGDGRIWKITLRDGNLFVVDHLHQRFPLLPLGANRFRPVGGFFHETARFEFARDSAASPYTITSTREGGLFEMEPVKLVEPTSVELAAYAGEFYSDELATTYQFKVFDEKLFLRVGNLGWEPLDATVCDVFVPAERQNHDNRRFAFGRDEQGHVVGLSVGLWRVKGVAFAKVQ